MVSGLVPNLQAALIGCRLMGLLRCIDLESAYRSIHRQSLVLIDGMLPFALALQRTGGIDLAATALLDVMGDASPRAVLAGLFVVTAGLGLFIADTATAVLMAPVALALAQELQASPYLFAMIVALAASSALMTPVSSPVNTLVGPRNCTFVDFVRVGVPFTPIALIVSVALVRGCCLFDGGHFRRRRTRASQRERPGLDQVPAGLQRRLGSRVPCREICRARTAEVNIGR